MSIRPKNRGLVYLRRSSGRQETSLETQLEWAIAEAARLKVILAASLVDLQHMRTNRLTAYKDLRLDDSITGADLSRPGFLSLNQDCLGNKNVSHVFIHKRDRFGRPEDPIGMVGIERKLLLAGITLVFTDNIAEPMERGRQYPERDLAMLFGYYESGAFLTKLAERVLEKQRLLAREGFRTGGSASYGFVRVLVDGQGRFLEELAPGRRVRQAGCHVRLMPKDGAKLRTRLYILDLKHRGWGFKRIAVHLNKLAIPSPDAGKIRTDHGVPHVVNGRWSASTVREICLDPINIGLQEFGRRSEGAHRRLGEEGPRLLTESDRNDRDKARTVMNDKSITIKAATGIEPLVDDRRFEEMRRQIEERGKGQRGIPRAKDPARYPLSCRIVDLTDGCGAVMYGRTHGKRPIYVCGRYMRTEAADCENNAVDGEAILRFTLKTLQQVVDRHSNREKLRQILLERARQISRESISNPTNQESQIMQEKVEELKEHVAIVRRRMALEKDDSRYSAIAEEFDRLNSELKAAEKALEARRLSCPLPAPHQTPEAEVSFAMALFDDIRRISTDNRARSEINPLLEKLGLRIGLNFGSGIKGKKRVVRRLLGGVVSFGDYELPVPLYGSSNRQGPFGCGVRGNTGLDRNESCLDDRSNGRAETEKAGSHASALVPANSELKRLARPFLGQREAISFTKASRGDWIRTSDLLNPIQSCQ